MGVSHQRISALVKKGVLPVNAKYRIDVNKAVKIMEGRRKLDNSQGGFGELTDARTVHEKIKIERARLDLQKEKRELVEVAKVVEEWQDMISIAKKKLLAMPSELAPLLIGHRSQKKIKSLIEDKIHAALNELARE